MHLHFREFQHLCCRQKMSRINFIDCRFFAFGCVKPHCQFEIADVYSRTAKDRKCRNDVVKWCEPITAASLNKYGEVFCMAIRCANQPLEDLKIGNLIMCVVGVIPFGMHQSLPILSSAVFSCAPATEMRKSFSSLIMPNGISAL